MRPTTITVFEEVISKPRLNSYKQYFSVSTDEAIGLYMWNCELSACFSALLSFFEIALRNNAHYTLSQFHGSCNSYHWYDKIQSSLKPNAIKMINDVRYKGPSKKQRQPIPGPDEIVSRVSFGFWPSVLGVIDLRFANHILPNIFPFHPLNINPKDWCIATEKRKALEFIYELNDFRNRLAHHEPLWKFAAINSTIVAVPASNNQAESLARFSRLLALYDDAMSALNQDFHADILQSSWRQKLNYLLSTRGIARYKALKHCPDRHSLTPTEFRRKLSFISKENRPVRVENTKMKGLFIPE
ncbi:MAG: Abi family protein [Methylobacter sp.]|uniref:Abi family protein n=1 Tax=Methylobacter sp. TaxID=2051955 RepID=UPI0027318599|nr:Abi family protein [Methylobacter sp.]MDP1666134.1 Abi family protein [Methylobacter sp.]